MEKRTRINHPLTPHTIHKIAERACELFGKEKQGLLNSDCFSIAFCEATGVEGPLNEKVVEAIICGVRSITMLGPGHYELIQRYGS